MKKTKIMALLLSATLVFSGCGNMNNTAKGGLIGGGGGALTCCSRFHYRSIKEKASKIKRIAAAT